MCLLKNPDVPDKRVAAEPIVATVHEFYYLIGCGHGVAKTKCYQKIAEIKASRPIESDFFPGMTQEGKFLLTREEANEVVQEFLREKEAETRVRSARQ